MKVRIVKEPSGNIDGLSLQAYRKGEVYDIPPAVAMVLVAEGFAIIEMRGQPSQNSSRVPERRAAR